MRLTALLAAALLSASTVAMAQPDGRWNEHHDRYDHDHDHDQGYRIPRDQWSTFATHVRLVGRRGARIDMRGIRVHSIELQALRGGADITNIVIRYHDGSRNLVSVNRPLDARNAPNLRFDVDQGVRGIDAIIVEGAGNVAFRVIGG